jgi:hypothetical protein
MTYTPDCRLYEDGAFKISLQPLDGNSISEIL